VIFVLQYFIAYGELMEYNGYFKKNNEGTCQNILNEIKNLRTKDQNNCDDSKFGREAVFLS
jgi:hypothetical protein